MVHIGKVYTKGGDKGETSLVGGKRIPKDHPRVEAYGTIDELGSTIGLVRYHLNQTPDNIRREKLDSILDVIQHWLFDFGSELATDPEYSKKTGRGIAIGESQVTRLEEVIDVMNEELKPLDSFVFAGGGPVSAFLHQARTVCRRAERRILALSREEELGEWAVPFINRLSDALFVFTRWSAQSFGEKEILWQPANKDMKDWSWK